MPIDVGLAVGNAEVAEKYIEMEINVTKLGNLEHKLSNHQSNACLILHGC